MHMHNLSKSPRWTFLGLVLAVAAAFGLLAGGAISVQAQNTNGSCTVPSSGLTNCTLVTSVAVAPGGTLTATITSPANATISAITGMPANCTLTSGAGTASVTASCTAASTGIAAGASLVEAISVPAGATGITQIVNYNDNGGTSGIPAGAGVPAQTTTTGSCTPTVTAPGNVTCTNFPTVMTVAGGTLVVNVGNQASPGTVQITGANPTAGTCPLTSTTPQPAAPATFASVTYTCGAGQSVPQFSPVSVTVAVASTAFPTPTAPVEQTISNANGPTTGTPAVPAMTQTTATFSVTAATPLPVITAITPSSGAAGSTVTIIGTGLNGATGISFGNTAGTNITCNTAGTQCTVNAPNLATNTAAGITVTTPGGTSNPFTFTFSSLPALNVLVTGPGTGTVGQTVSVTPSATASTGATITTYSVNFGDGSTAVTVSAGQAATHTYATAGSFVVTATATDTAGASGTGSTTVTITASAPPGVPVTYQPGWNIVAGPAGTVITGNLGPLYTFQTGDTAYEIIQNGTPLRAGLGYWAYFTTATAVSLPIVPAQAITVTMPAGQFIQVGNPTDTTVNISGADAVDTYNPTTGQYQTGVTTLSPGQGAWIFSYNGGTLTMSPR